MIQLLSVADMRESDKTTIENGTDSKLLMFRAGEAIFNTIKNYAQPFAIVCGNGNNAGDGYVLATLMKKAGISCSLFRITDRFSADGKYYYDQCMELGIKDFPLYDAEFSSLDDYVSLFEDYPTIVDCIFGTGFHGDVKEPERSIISAINIHSNNNVTLSDGSQIPVSVVSVDINSGLNGDNGLCDICVHSSLTISIGNLKPGHFLSMAKDVAKKTVNCDIGIVPVSGCTKLNLIEASDLREIFYDRPHNSNKGTYGYIGLIGGSDNYSGAIRLANMAACAMRSGSGVVKLAAPACLGPVIMPSILESTFYPLSDVDQKMVFVQEEFERLMNLSAIAFGMGIGNTVETKKALEYILVNYKGTLIIDADGLNALSEMDKNILLDTSANVVLTPHPKEFSRLTGLGVNDVLCKPIELSMDFAKKYNVTLLLKGASTIVTDGDSVYICDRGCAGMATAGSGDVLSGVVAAVCGYNRTQPTMATVAAAYVAGLAGELASDKYGDISMVASDTAMFLAKAINYVKN